MLENDTTLSETALSTAMETSATVTLPFPKHGVCLSYFPEMILNVCGGYDNVKDLTTTDVCNKFVMPHTAATRSSLCDLLSAQGHSAVQQATVFISHAWKFKFLDVVNALENHFKDQPNIVVWFDLFSNNQHIGPTLTFDWWCGTFKTAIHDMQHVVMVMAPWEDPIPLTRAWCLFELYCAAETGCTFEIALSSTEVTSFLMGIVEKAEEMLNDMMSIINVERSESFKPEDKEMIFKVVEQTVGFSAINSMVFEQIRNWVLTTLEHHVYELYVQAWSQSKNLSVRPAMRDMLQNPSLELMNDEIHHAMVSLAILYRMQSKFSDSERFYRLCHTWYSKQYGENHQHSLVRLNNVAYSVLVQGDLQLATEIYEDCLARQQEHHSSTIGYETSIFATMGSLATCYQQTPGKLAAAESMFRQLLEREIAFFGNKENEYVMKSMNNLAVVLDLQGQYLEAEELYKELLTLVTHIKGPDHPETLRVMSNLGTLFLNPRLKKYDQAEPILKQCLAKRQVVLGVNHVDTLHVMGNLSVLLQDTNRLSEASTLLNKVYYGRIRLLGETHPMSLQSMHNLATLYRDLAKSVSDNQPSIEGNSPSKEEYLNLAENLFESCISLQEEHLGKDHIETIRGQFNLALLYDDLGKFDKSLPLLRKILHFREETLGLDHPDTHHVHHLIAFTFQRLERYSESMKEHETVLQRRFAKFGPVYTGTWSTVYFLALAIDSQYPSPFPVSAQIFGDTSLSLCEHLSSTENNDYRLWKRQCDWVEEELLKLFRSQLLESIPFENMSDGQQPIEEKDKQLLDLKRSMLIKLLAGYEDLLARFYRAQCHRIAKNLMRALSEMTLRMHNNDESHEKVLSSQYGFAKFLVRQPQINFASDGAVSLLEDELLRAEDNREGEQLLFVLWEKRCRRLGLEHPLTIQVTFDYATCLLSHASKEDKVRAETLLRNAYRNARRVFGQSDTRSMQIAKTWWEALEATGKYLEAEKLLYPILFVRGNGRWRLCK